MSSTKVTPPETEKYKRPSWDEYFMEVANTIAKRATCDRGRSGCVIARNRQILVTGYVGSPMGFKHCDEAGHQFKKLVHEEVVCTVADPSEIDDELRRFFSILER